MREIDNLPYAGRYACASVVLAFFLVFLQLAPAWAEPLRLNADSNAVSAAHYAKFARDKSGELSVLDMIDATWLAPAQVNAAGFPSFGYTDEAIWLRLDIENTGDEDVEVLLELAVARLRSLTWFVLDDERVVKQVKDGMTGRTHNSRSAVVLLGPHCCRLEVGECAAAKLRRIAKIDADRM